MVEKIAAQACIAVIMSFVALMSGSSFAATSDFDESLKQVARELAKGIKQHRIHRVAVEPFTDLDGRTTQLGRFVADELATDLATSHAIQVIDQHQLAAQLEKYKIVRLSSLPHADLRKVGKELDLDGVIAGSVVESINHLRLTAKLIAIRTGSPVIAAKATLPKTGLLAELAQPQAESGQSGQKLEAAPAIEGQQSEDMVLIPAGSFIFGEGDRQRSILLPDFWIDLYEVTNSRYNDLRAIEYDPLRSHHPVINVSWDHARQFCLMKGKRLPTEQEWEKAARGTDGRLYPWGNTYEPSYANAENRIGDSTPVGRYEEGRSPYGLYDMAGNVMEWTASGEQAKVFRGGSWASSPQDIRITARNSVTPAYRLIDLGFRCAKDGPR